MKSILVNLIKANRLELTNTGYTTLRDDVVLNVVSYSH